MKFNITVNYKGQPLSLAIKTESYPGKKLYHVEQYDTLIYCESETWKCDTEHRLDHELLQLIGKEIESYNTNIKQKRM